ncbi:LysR family transcriptional regulator [Microbacterium dextranolyticum]|uniref:LysR family transcriptional regulator n=1 Tax=Microbacterium dextranolyticum TaxID=36806 RepID=A0A9W6HL49_9MICO|nr:LysR family transcriptional regulator [Microbacterium dextranolyticum]MBM7463528.1 DNA-binding transcriptional LysR family regulator [Microbacterium dextranolyticum]GLJ94630.1 LysR family transcriptional regulator [Microbacterium dextranolyticum]
MDVRHLSVFVAVAQEMSFTRAADRLLLAQSAVSTTVRELERELGVALFDRSHRQIRLTGAGEELLARSRDVLERMREIGEAVAAAGTELRGTVTVGLMTGVDLVDVPSLLGAFHARHPAVVLQLRATGLGSSGLVAQLERGEIDLALLAAVDGLPATLQGEIVASSPYALVVPEAHPLAGRDVVGLDELEGERFIDLPPGYGSRRIVDDAFAHAGVSRRVLIEVAEISTAAQYVPQGLGLALVPRFAVAGAITGTRVVSAADAVPPFDLSLAWARRRPLSSAAEALVQLVRTALLPAV